MKIVPVGKEVEMAFTTHRAAMDFHSFNFKSVQACLNAVMSKAQKDLELDENLEWAFDDRRMAFVGTEKVKKEEVKA